MARLRKKGSSPRQLAYARRVFSGQGVNKKQIALDVGYSPYVANSISSHIESKQGFNNAMAALAMESNNLALAAMHEFKARGFEDFNNKDLVAALSAIGNAWDKFSAPIREVQKKDSTNKLRTVILQQVENQNIQVPNVSAPASTTNNPNDF